MLVGCPGEKWPRGCPAGAAMFHRPDSTSAREAVRGEALAEAMHSCSSIGRVQGHLSQTPTMDQEEVEGSPLAGLVGPGQVSCKDAEMDKNQDIPNFPTPVSSFPQGV